MVVSRARVASNDQKHITIPKDASTDSWGLPVPNCQLTYYSKCIKLYMYVYTANALQNTIF